MMKPVCCADMKDDAQLTGQQISYWPGSFIRGSGFGCRGVS